jgi:hypothetical protein
MQIHLRASVPALQIRAFGQLLSLTWCFFRFHFDDIVNLLEKLGKTFLYPEAYSYYLSD